MVYRSISLALLGASVALTSAAQSKPVAGADWVSYAHDMSGTKFSPLSQINTTNVNQLQQVWQYHMSPAGQATKVAGKPSSGGGRRSSQATPLVVNDVMYLATPYSTVIALKPETGELLWTYKVPGGRPTGRAVIYWPGDAQTPASILFGTGDGRMLSITAKDGTPTPGFGTDGAINLKEGIDENPAGSVNSPEGHYTMTSPGAVYKNLIITGASVQESPERGPSGDIRAWDVHTGKLAWRFHTVPRPGEPGHETWPADNWKGRSGTNVWGMMSVDEKNGLVFLPLGSPTFDFYGGDRPGKNLYGNSLVALHADTGKLAWYFQLVHHDITDYDLESAPIMITVKRGGHEVPAVAVTTKTGLLFMFNRLTGKPIYKVEERPVPQSTIPGEHSWPTQPFPTKPVQLGRSDFTPADLSTVTPEHHDYCEKLLATEGGMTYGPMFRPFGPKLTIQFPGTIGATNWPGMSYDPKLGYLFVNTNDLADVGKIAPTSPGSDPPYERTSPWGMYARFWQEDKFWPCQQPPWGQMWAIDVNTGEVAWKVPFGVVPELDAKGVHNTGALNYGGSIATGGGVVFIAATDDQHFRAFEAKTGKTLWDIKMDTGAYVTPMTFQGSDGRQYVVIVDTGGSFFDRTSGDSILAFALPKQ